MWERIIGSDEDFSFEEKIDHKALHRRNAGIFFGTLLAVTTISLLFREIMSNPDVNLTMFYILGIVVVARFTSGYIWGFLFSVVSVVSIVDSLVA